MKRMRACLVPGCTSTLAACNGAVAVHPVPSASSETWLDALGISPRTDLSSAAHVGVCSQHFASSDYLTLDKGDNGMTLTLKDNAVPSRNITRNRKAITYSKRKKSLLKKHAPKSSLQSSPKSCWDPSAFASAAEVVQQDLMETKGQGGGVLMARISNSDEQCNTASAIPSVLLTPQVQNDLQVAGITLQNQLSDKPQVILMPMLLVNNQLHFIRLSKTVPSKEDNPQVPEKTNILQAESYQSLSSRAKQNGKPPLVGYTAGEVKQCEVTVACRLCAASLSLLELAGHVCQSQVPAKLRCHCGMCFVRQSDCDKHMQTCTNRVQ